MWPLLRSLTSVVAQLICPRLRPQGPNALKHKKSQDHQHCDRSSQGKRGAQGVRCLSQGQLETGGDFLGVTWALRAQMTPNKSNKKD